MATRVAAGPAAVQRVARAWRQDGRAPHANEVQRQSCWWGDCEWRGSKRRKQRGGRCLQEKIRGELRVLPTSSYALIFVCVLSGVIMWLVILVRCLFWTRAARFGINCIFQEEHRRPRHGTVDRVLHLILILFFDRTREEG